MRFSLRSRASSSRSAVVRPVRPPLRSARARSTHCRKADSVRSNSRATAPTVFPSSNTSRTAPARNSSLNAGVTADVWLLPFGTSYPPFGTCPRDRIKPTVAMRESTWDGCGKMPRPTGVAHCSRTLVEAKSAQAADFSDLESQRVLAAAVCAVARELGREAAREYFAELIRKPRFPA